LCVDLLINKEGVQKMLDVILMIPIFLLALVLVAILLPLVSKLQHDPENKRLKMICGIIYDFLLLLAVLLICLMYSSPNIDREVSCPVKPRTKGEVDMRIEAREMMEEGIEQLVIKNLGVE